MSSKGNALGFIESVGLASAIAAADAALKAANVELIGRENSKGYGYITVKIAGDVGAVNAAINAAKMSSSKVARVWSTDVIPRPAKDLGDVMVWNRETQGAQEWVDIRKADSASSLPIRRGDVTLAQKGDATLANPGQIDSTLVKKEDSPLANRPVQDIVLVKDEETGLPEETSEETEKNKEAKESEKPESKGKKSKPQSKPGGRGKKPKP